jgi:hypothetical protein
MRLGLGMIGVHGFFALMTASASKRVEREERKVLVLRSSRRRVRSWGEGYGESQEKELHRELN